MVKKTRKNRGVRSGRERVFTKKDFNSGDGMVTTVWGPATWHFLHTISFNYPVHPTARDKKNYRDFILSLQYVLPCRYCRENLKKNLARMPLTMRHMKNRDTFSRYIYELHELVNKMLDKDSGLSYCDVRERYEHFRSRCTQEFEPKIFSDAEIKSAYMKTKHDIKGKTKKNRAAKEKGCTEPLYGKKSRCIIKIVPQNERGQSLKIDQKCIKRRV